MRLKALEIHGFKSFVDKTVLRFREGITAIVGPNGCGKSNVVDAVRWAMGEQAPRRLRGRGMEDVIFAGSESRAPVGMAEVSLVFDTSDGGVPPPFGDYPEVRISRRLYRSGESEYLINKTQVRLRDVLDFFRDTGVGTRGYTIVEQGRIAEIVSMRPEERRLLIEEAAGISKYKARRREAESKIASTEQNLARVSDVLGEIRRQIGSLERQARKAARYKALREEMRLLDLSLAADDRRERVARIDEAETALEHLRDAVTALDARVAERELALRERRIHLAERERLLAEGSESLFALRARIVELESRIEFEQREREQLGLRAEEHAEELERLREQRAAAAAELERSRDELAALESASGAAAERLAAAEAEARDAATALRELERERERLAGLHLEAVTRIARAEDRVQSLEERRTALEQRLRSLDAEMEAHGVEAGEAGREEAGLEERLRELLEERDRLMNALRAALGRQEERADELQLLQESLQALREQRETARARLVSLRELLETGETLPPGTRHLLADPGREGVRGLLRELVEVDPGFERAAEAALGDRADALVVDSAARGLGLLRELARSAAGGAVLQFPLPEVHHPTGLVPLGEPLLERVRPQPGVAGLVHELLAGVNVVEDLGEALEVYGNGRLPATFVTREGDLLRPDGLLVGGGDTGREGSLRRQREVHELDLEVAELDRQVRAEERRVRGAEAALSELREEIENLRNRHHTAALAVASLEGDLERQRERAKALVEAREARLAERRTRVAELARIDEELAGLGERLEADRAARARHQEALDAIGVRIAGATRALSRLEARATERRVEHAGRVERRDRLVAERERAEERLAQIEAFIGRREREIAEAGERREALAASLEEAREKLARALREEEAARVGHEERRDLFEREAGLVREIEKEISDLRADLARRKDEVAAEELELQKLRLGLEQLEERIRDRWGVDLAAWTPPPPPGGGEATAAGPTPSLAPEGSSEVGSEEEPPPVDLSVVRLPRAEREVRLAEVRRKLEALGEVNLAAIDEHEELRERYRFLSEQKADLEATLASLRDAIQRINRTSRKRFRETFEQVDARFREIFPRLFRGGRASLELTEAEDLLEAGIEIMAQPPGKRLQTVALLSGGEKTMTALALLVSLFQVHPSPFFLLDEVDAALDDANVGRFNEIVKEMADRSQFLVITHNKRTIEVADVLYGLTMESKGVSKVVSVELT